MSETKKYNSVLTKGVKSSLDKTSIENEKLRFTTDTRQIFLDTNNERIEISDFVKGMTESEILETIAPLPKIYISSDTNKFMVFDNEEMEWTTVAANAEKVNNHTVEADVPEGAVFTDTTYSDMTGASSSAAGTHGLVPAPAAGNQDKFLRGDGTWQTALTSHQDISGKADKATTLSGYGITDAATSTQGTKADSAVQSVKITGSDTELKSGTNVVLPAYPTTLPASDVKSWAKADSKPTYTATEVGAIASTEKGANNGVATLGNDGKIPSSQLPSYVDDVLEYNGKTNFPATGESGKIYVDTSDNKTYRWSGTSYVEISSSIVVGTTTGTAFDGKSGKDHVDNTTVHITAAERTAWNAKTSNTGTITEIKMNGASVGTSGSVDLGTVITSHQDISGKQDKSTAVTHTASTAAGSATQPVYIAANGVATATTYTLGKSVPSDAKFTDTDTHYASGTIVNNASTSTANTTAALTNGNVYLNHIENGAVKNSHKISGSGATTVTSDASGNIVISSTDNNTTYSAATTSAAGLMSAADKTKLDGIATGATANTGTITEIKMNGASKGTSGSVDLGTVITSHQDISGKQDKSTAVTHTASTAVGSATQPVYIAANGVATATTYSLGKSVPSDAKFTDTDTVTTATTTGSGNAVTSITASNGALTVTKGATFLTSHQDISGKANLASPALTGTPTAPTANSGTNTTQIATTAFVQSAIDTKIAAADAMIYKGTIGTGGTVTALPSTTAKTGWTYKVLTAGTYDSKACEVGDMIICLTDGSSSTNATWTVVQNNIDGAVTGPSSSVDARVAVFNGTTGKIIKDSGYTIGKSVPSNAVFTDTTYSAATTSAAGLMSAADKTKLDGIAASANNYSHPTTSGNKHIPSGGSSGQILRWSADGTAAWGADNNTTYSAATTSAAGLMSAADKTKLDGIATSANNYSHPTTSGNKHIPSGGSSGQILRWSADGTAAWGSDNNTDTKVEQAVSTSANWRNVLLKSSEYDASTTDVTTTTDKAYAAKGVAVQPSTGILRTNGYSISDKCKLIYDSTNECVSFVFT